MRERKFKKKRNPRKVYLVICEGETEKAYVETLRRHYRLPVTIKTKVSGNSINARLIGQYVAELGVDSSDDYCIFFIYDADVQCVADKLATLPGTAILTNPCIELWYVLHVREHNRAVDSYEVMKNLMNSHPVWKNYMKGHLTNEQTDMLLKNYKSAIFRSEKLSWPLNPSSNMGTFINALENPENC